MIDDHEIVRRQAERLTPPEPAFERLLGRHHRRRRNQRLAAGAIGIAVFAAAVAIPLLSGASRGSSPRPADRSASPSPSVSVAPARYPDRVGFIGVPPVGAVPSVPEDGDLVLSFYGGTQSGPGRSCSCTRTVGSSGDRRPTGPSGRTGSTRAGWSGASAPRGWN